MNLKDGEACGHRACLSHKTYPCPFCGRIDGRALTHSERVALAIEKEYCDPSLDGGREEYFADVVERIGPLVEEAFNDGLMTVPEIDLPNDLWVKDSKPVTLHFENHAADSPTDFSIGATIVTRHLPMSEPRPWLTIPEKRTIMALPKAIWAVVTSLGSVLRDVVRGWRDDIYAFGMDMQALSNLPKTLLGLPVYVASSKREEQERRDHYWKTVYGPRLREYLEEHREDQNCITSEKVV